MIKLAFLSARRSLSIIILSSFSFPKHKILSMPALSPTMKEGKIVVWLVKEGDKVQPGDAIAQIQTDKATVAFQVQEKGFVAKINTNTDLIPIGSPVAVITKKSDQVSQFSSFSFEDVSKQATPQKSSSKQVSQATDQATKQTLEFKQKSSDSSSKTVDKPAKTDKASKKTTSQTKMAERSSGEKVIASPLAKSIANQKNIELSSITGSGPGGRILKQDVESFISEKRQESKKDEKEKQQSKDESRSEQNGQKKNEKKRFVAPENPLEDIALSNMRKTIASRLSQSKQNIPHYYISLSIEMDRVNQLRNELNMNENKNGVKISLNDIIIKAMALGLRDYPNANVQWQGNSIRKFKHADVSVAVATEGGLITPIVYQADILGLLDIARRTKDIAKRAREGKLDPIQYAGGTTTVSNLGMFGINTVISIINPPQATILGVGKTQKKLVYSEGAQPFRVAQIMDVIASCDHRAVDGALAAQWLNRIKHYLQNPSHMLL